MIWHNIDKKQWIYQTNGSLGDGNKLFCLYFGRSPQIEMALPWAEPTFSWSWLFLDISTFACQGETVGRPFAETGQPTHVSGICLAVLVILSDLRWNCLFFGLWGENPSPRKERERLDLEAVAATSDEPHIWKNKDVWMLKCFTIDENLNRCQMIDVNDKYTCGNWLDLIGEFCSKSLFHACIQQMCCSLCVERANFWWWLTLC